MEITFVLSLVSRGHDFPGSIFCKQHKTDLPVCLCLDSYMEQGSTWWSLWRNLNT